MVEVLNSEQSFLSVETTAGNTDAKKTTGTTATEPDKTVIPDWTTDDATYPPSDVVCYFEYAETGVATLPRVTHAYLADGSAAKNGATYYVASDVGTAVVKTDVDFGTAKFVIDDTKVENINSPLFCVEAGSPKFSVKGVKSLKKGQANLGVPCSF